MFQPYLRVALPALLALSACQADVVEVTMQQARAQRIGAGGFLALDLLATDGDTVIPCDDGNLDVTVSVTGEGENGHFTELPPQSWILSCDDGRTGDLSLVVDNSGSEDGFLPWLKDAARTMAHEIIDRGGRVSLTRVSTNAEISQGLTASREQIDGALDDMFITNGWTALWDGVRYGNEALGGSDGPSGTRTAIEDFCFSQRPLGVVAFTDGADNNSADEMALEYDVSKYPGDGVATTPETLRQMRVGDAVTPIYTVGLGDEVDHDSLQALASATGGRHRAIEREEDIPGVFGVLQSYFDATHEVCMELPELECGELIVRVDWSWTPPGGGDPITGQVQDDVTLACTPDDGPTEGRVATILLTLGDPGIPTSVSSTLALQAVEWASPRLRPHVLIVLDDGHNGEDVTDAELIQWLLDDVDTLTVTYMDEPTGGLTPSDVEGYDVVWYANPGYPMDDLQAFETLQGFVDAGGGLVLQGDDMTWSAGHAFEMTDLTGLDYINNGSEACGQRIDNGNNGTYTVTVSNDDHAISRGLEGQTFLYGNDIDDSTVVSEWAEVVAWAQPTTDSDCPARPVIVGFSR